MEEGEEITGPWRATRLWNNIIRNFRSGMPLRKHKKNLKTYESCFSSTEAIDWLHKNLQKNPNFGTEVTKEQTTQLLKKLFRANIIENVREDAGEEEFKVSGELYRFSTRSPGKMLRTPGKQDRRPLADTGNTPRTSRSKEKGEGAERRERSGNRKAKEEMKKQLNLSYFQALPSNSLIILDNDDIWRRVYVEQLTRVLSSVHTERLDYAGQLDMENIMHNMTKVSAKGIVQVEDKYEDLPHWVLSAMKCLANWPKQLKTVNGKESCLPSYAGFEHDVFNVVKDYFLGLTGPLTTSPLYEFLIDAYNVAEHGNDKYQTRGVKRLPATMPNPSVRSASLQRPSMQTYTDQGAGEFYTMTDAVEDISMLSNQERVAKIKQTFQVLPPLATSSLQTSNNSNNSGHTTFDTTSASLSPEMSTTAIMKQFLPPNTCFETAFVEELPTTRIVPQKEHEVLHFKRSWSGRSLSHIPTDWATKTTSTQTDASEQQQQQNLRGSFKRVPKWKRSSRVRKSIAVMEGQDRSCLKSGVGIDNCGFIDTPRAEVNIRPDGRPRQLKSTGSLPPESDAKTPMRAYSSVDNLLDRESKFEEEFMLKYRQVSGDLRASVDLMELSERNTSSDRRDRSFIQSKAVRKEKKKRGRNTSTDRLGYETDTDIRYDAIPRQDAFRHCYVNRAMEQTPGRADNSAPLASHETTSCDLSPVPFNRHNKYNNSYRLATNQPATPAGQKLNLPRTSTKISLEPTNNNVVRGVYLDDMKNVRAEPYLNSDVSSIVAPTFESLYTCVGQGPLLRYPVPRLLSAPPQQRSNHFRRDTAARASRSSQATTATVDSGRYSDYSRTSISRIPQQPDVSDHYSKYSKTVPHHVLAERLHGLAGQTEAVETRAILIFKLITLLIPPANRRKLQLLLKFIRKVSLNDELRLDGALSNRELSLNTFTNVILRPADMYSANLSTDRKIVNLFIDKYDEVWMPPESLRKEVEEKVYHNLVNRRIQAGEDPYPVTYCKQVTKAEYEAEKMTGAESALLDLLQAILVDRKMGDKEKIKKMKKFKDAYPHIWRRKFPNPSSEPELVAHKEKANSKFGSLSRIKSVMGM